MLAGVVPADELERIVSALTASRRSEPGQARALVDRRGTEAADVVDVGVELDLLRPLDDATPHLEVEVAWAVRREAALGLDDILSRRLRLSSLRRDRCASIAPHVAAIVGAGLGWDQADQARRVDVFLEQARREYDVPVADADMGTTA